MRRIARFGLATALVATALLSAAAVGVMKLISRPRIEETSFCTWCASRRVVRYAKWAGRQWIVDQRTERDTLTAYLEDPGACRHEWALWDSRDLAPHAG